MNSDVTRGADARPVPKTVGPFTGRQLTTIICVIATLVLFPFGAWAAVAGSNAFITDPSTGNRAVVANGALTVNVAPTHNFIASHEAEPAAGHGAALFTATGTHADVVTEVQVAWEAMTAESDFFIIGLGKVDPLHPGNGPCGLASPNAFTSVVFELGGDSKDVVFNPGFVVPSGTSLCVDFNGTGNISTRAYGYFTNNTAVTSPFLGRWVSNSSLLRNKFGKR
jgi:hypothetical protein